MSALHLAVRSRNATTTLIPLLTEAGAPLEHVNDQGFTALGLATVLNKAEFRTALLEAGADPAQAEGKSITIRSTWEQHQHDPVALRKALSDVPQPWDIKLDRNEYLFESIVRLRFSRWTSAQPTEETKKPWREFVQWMFAQGYPHTLENEKGYPALHLAVKAGDLKLVSIVLEAGADVNALSTHKGYGTYTPLHMVHGIQADRHQKARTAQTRYQIAERLIKAGADVNKESTHNTPLKNAINGHWYLLDLYVKAGAKLDYTEKDGETLWFHINWRDKRSMAFAQRLLDAGVKVDALGARNDSALTRPARRGHDEALTLLLKHGGKRIINEIDRDNMTPLDWAYNRKNESTIKLLKQAGGKTAIELNNEPDEANSF